MECCICLEPMSVRPPKVVMATCCGNTYHRKCMRHSLQHKTTCPLCRQEVALTDNQSLAYIRNHVKNNKAWAFCLIGLYYLHGWGGLQKSVHLAEAFLERGISMGNPDHFMIADAKYELAKVLRFRGTITEERKRRASILMYEAAAAGVPRAVRLFEKNYVEIGPDGTETPMF